MKKLLVLGLLALGLVALSQQRAAAWCKWSISCGFNISYEGGNNCFLWGLLKSGQCPGYPTDACGCACCGPYGGSPGFYGDVGGYPASYGGDHAAYVAPAPHPVSGGQGSEPPAAKSDTASARYGQSGYQPVGYYQGYQGSYYQQPTSNYYQGSYYQGNYGQAPSYWYGN